MNPRVKHVCGRLRPKREKEGQFGKKKKRGCEKRSKKKSEKNQKKHEKRGRKSSANHCKSGVEKKVKKK